MAANSIIVQCLKCNKVLSDSTALVLSDKERKILGVKGASSIQVHEETVSDPSDGGDSEYNIITCVQCSAEVGKVYVRTSQETAKLQDLISLSTDAVCSYQLGRHEMRVQGTGDLNPLSEERVTRLEEQMVKVENVLVLFNERWHAMESALRQLQQRVDVVSTPSQRHGMAWGMGPTGASPSGASPGGGGGGSVGRGPGGGVGMPMLPGEAGGRGGGGSPYGADVGGGGGGGGGFRSAGSGAAAAMYGSPHFRGQRAQ